MSEFTGYIYKLTSPSGKVYIGQTKNLVVRKSSYRSLSKSIRGQRKLYAAIKKCGFENFQFETLLTCSSQVELDSKEIDLIESYDSIVKGYNIMRGGCGGVHSEETKQRLREVNLGKKQSQETIQKRIETRCKRGIKSSPDHIRRLQEGRDSAPPGMLGKTHSEETKDKIRKASIERPKSSKHKQALSKAKQKYNYTITDPNGIEYTSTNLKQFCLEHDLIFGPVYGIVNKDKMHKGWRVARKPLST